jgi:hypothetical protein
MFQGSTLGLPLEVFHVTTTYSESCQNALHKTQKQQEENSATSKQQL